MKKIVSLIAAVSMLFALSTSAFAFSGAVSGDASLEGTTITAGDEGFVFKFIADTDVKGGSSIKSDLANLINAGWEISDVDGTYAEDDDVTQGFATSPVTQLQVKLNGSSVHATAGKAVFMFKATPVNVAAGTSVTFQVAPTLMKSPSGMYTTRTTYTVVKAAVQEDKTTATIAANGEVTFDYADADAADAKLDGKKVVLSTTAVAGNEITADTTVAVTYTDGDAVETKTFGETLFEKLGAEGFGFLEADSITFGIVCDTTMTGTFSFALN